MSAAEVRRSVLDRIAQIRADVHARRSLLQADDASQSSRDDASSRSSSAPALGDVSPSPAADSDRRRGGRPYRILGADAPDWYARMAARLRAMVQANDPILAGCRHRHVYPGRPILGWCPRCHRAAVRS